MNWTSSSLGDAHTAMYAPHAHLKNKVVGSLSEQGRQLDSETPQCETWHVQGSLHFLMQSNKEEEAQICFLDAHARM